MIIIIRPNRKHTAYRATYLCRRENSRGVSFGVVVTPRESGVPLLVSILHHPTIPRLSCAEEARKTLRSLNLSRAGPVAKSTALAAQPRSCGCPGFHNANYDRFVLPLRKCSGERRRAHRLGYRFLRTLKLQLCPRSRACFIRRVFRRRAHVVRISRGRSCITLR